MIISVIGGSKAKPEHLALAEEVGQELGKRNVMVACGGLHGVMEAVCRGAKSVGGTTIGILPGRTSKDANNYVDIPIVTTMGFSRNVIGQHWGRCDRNWWSLWHLVRNCLRPRRRNPSDRS